MTLVRGSATEERRSVPPPASQQGHLQGKTPPGSKHPEKRWPGGHNAARRKESGAGERGGLGLSECVSPLARGGREAVCDPAPGWGGREAEVHRASWGEVGS